MLNVALFAIGAYLWAAIPSAYLVTRYLKGTDIRRYGSGNMGAVNVMTYVGSRTGFLLGIYDCLAKGMLPVILAKLLDQSLGAQVAAGLAAIAGHNWSPYVRFTGGRGVATGIGVIVGSLLFFEALILTVVIGGLGRLLFRDTGFWTFVAMLALPILAFLFGNPVEILVMTVLIGVLLIAKRLTANWEHPATGYSLLRIMINRLIWDRDVSKKAEWIERSPASTVP